MSIYIKACACLGWESESPSSKLSSDVDWKSEREG